MIEKATGVSVTGDRMIGDSSAWRKVLRQIDFVAETGATVLITGETGTGKEVVARMIHARSSRQTRPLVTVNCGAVPESLFESEFFGAAKGAYTGASQDRAGRFELAVGGTLFLDEVAEIPLHLQAKLLRVLQEQEVERVGETQPRKLDVRVIAATNHDLKSEIEAHRFRSDLFYRLNVFPIVTPPLRARREDIPLLATHFLKEAACRLNRPTCDLTESMARQLADYDWPGNIRELQNVIERAVILAGEGLPEFEDLLANSAEPSDPLLTRTELKRRERDSIVAALERTRGRVAGPDGAAILLGMKPTTLHSRIQALGLQRSL